LTYRPYCVPVGAIGMTSSISSNVSSISMKGRVDNLRFEPIAKRGLGGGRPQAGLRITARTGAF
ncbi:MAG: hypothetical protein AAF268_06555, partial [Cyanobacteria bacterium P01_A01_bin.3]